MGRAPEVSLIVALRDTEASGWRTELWEFVAARMRREMPEVEIVVGTDDGDDPFHKTLAINRAAAEAKGSILALWDADSLVQTASLVRAISFVREVPNRWSRPWAVKLKMNEAATRHVLSLGESWNGKLPGTEFGRPESRNTYWAAPPLVVARSAFEAVGGMDERFRGWGQEDSAFALALTRVVGRLRSFPGVCIHLWHPRIGVTGNDLWPGQSSSAANRALSQRYQKATGREAMLEVIGGVSGTVHHR